MKHFIFIIATMFTISILGQNTLKNDYFSLELPNNTSYEKVNSVKEESSNVDLYKIVNTDNNQTKYLIYLMSNELNKDVQDITNYDFKSYLKDIGEAEILSNESITFDDQDFYKIKVGLKNDVKGLMYITSKKGMLYRLFFMLPNEDYYGKYLKEISFIFKSNDFL